MPKASVPIIFYQIERKLNLLVQQLSHFNKLNKELNDDIKSKFERLKTENAQLENNNNSNNTTNTTNHANHNKNNHFVEKLNTFEKSLDEKYQENVEIEVNFTKKIAAFRTQIELDENKFNQENLKSVKVDIDNLDNILRDKIRATNDEHDKLNQIFNSNKEKSLSEAVLNQFETEFEEIRKKPKPLTQQLQSLISQTSNSVRPSSGASDTSNNEANQTMSNLRTSQKSMPHSKFNFTLIIHSSTDVLSHIDRFF